MMVYESYKYNICRGAAGYLVLILQGYNFRLGGMVVWLCVGWKSRRYLKIHETNVEKQTENTRKTNVCIRFLKKR